MQLERELSQRIRAFGDTVAMSLTTLIPKQINTTQYFIVKRALRSCEYSQEWKDAIQTLINVRH